MGLTDEQVSQMLNMAQGAGGMLDDTQQSGSMQGMRGTFEAGAPSSSAASGYGINSWLLLGESLIMLLCGVWFVFSFKRRRINAKH